MKEVLLLVGLFCLFSCSKSNQEIVTTHIWKHGGGYPVAVDWLDFSGSVTSFSNDMVFENDSPVAVVDSITTYYGEYRLHVKSLLENKSGTYVEKGKRAD